LRKRAFSLTLSILTTGGIVWLFIASGLPQRIPGLLDSVSPQGRRDGEEQKTPVNTISSPVPSQTITPAPRIGPWSGWQAPDFTLNTIAGTTEQLSEYQGHIVMLNFWTSWCIPCKEEMSGIQAIYEKYQDQGFTVLGINITTLDERSEVESFVDALGLTFPILYDEDGHVSDGLYRVIGIPMSFFIDSEGKIYSVQVGALSEEKIDQLVAVGVPLERVTLGAAIYPPPALLCFQGYSKVS
jgi:peroxiredoxin